ncbi:LOB domain-containing protein 16-like [Impatiens glandulifera]|uniref:LOB domain-containing protein 16-like n=1 Tax=Impatiens glandulifera TaxID=253017 RepID=UPI001FB053F0|nr:LOB domain-containing protein 16-like [Impatiens glandulifera]
MASAANGTTTIPTGSPCGACKFLRRKCVTDCVFAPYFCSEQGPARFAAIHKVFGASNVSKLLMRVPVSDRCETVVTVLYEAQARLRDPVYGCVAHVFALQQQVAYLQGHLMQLKAHLAAQSLTMNNDDHDHYMSYNHDQFQVDIDDHTMAEIQSLPSNCSGNYPLITNSSMMKHSFSSQSLTSDSFESVDHESCRSDGRHEFSRKRTASQTDLGELQAIALRMMRN